MGMFGSICASIEDTIPYPKPVIPFDIIINKLPVRILTLIRIHMTCKKLYNIIPPYVMILYSRWAHRGDIYPYVTYTFEVLPYGRYYYGNKYSYGYKVFKYKTTKRCTINTYNAKTLSRVFKKHVQVHHTIQFDSPWESIGRGLYIVLSKQICPFKACIETSKPASFTIYSSEEEERCGPF